MSDQDGSYIPTQAKPLREFPFSSRPLCGIYLLMKGDKCVYVGQSISILARIGQHQLAEDKDFDDVWAMEVSKRNLNAVESALIQHFKPKYNETGKPFEWTEPTSNQQLEKDLAGKTYRERHRLGRLIELIVRHDVEYKDS